MDLCFEGVSKEKEPGLGACKVEIIYCKLRDATTLARIKNVGFLREIHFVNAILLCTP